MVRIYKFEAAKLKGEDSSYFWIEVTDGSYNFFAK